MDCFEFNFQHRRNVHSQNGEDGILEEMLARLGISGGWVAEVGAWDGKHYSNTYALVEKGGFRAVYVEGDPQKYRDLLATAAEHPRGTIEPVNEQLDVSKAGDHFGGILRRYSLDYAVVSIDIDSFDYEVWSRLELTPAIVVVEVDSGSTEPRACRGLPGDLPMTTFPAMLELGWSKGYQLVAHTGNMIFVRGDLFKKLNLELPKSPWLLFKTNWLHADEEKLLHKVLLETGAFD